jgi:HEAT repeat protein
MWASIAMGLGRLKEPRAVAGLAEGLRKDGEWLPFEPYPLFALGQIGGYEAEAAIVSYLDSPDRIAISDAVWALAKIDATKARVRAEMLLDDPNRKLSPKTREDLAEIAGRAVR